MPVEDGGAINRTGLITAENSFMTVGVSGSDPMTVPGIRQGDYLKLVSFVDFVAGVPQDGEIATDDFTIVADDQIQDKAGSGGTARNGELCLVVWYNPRFDEEPGYFPDNIPNGPAP